MRTGFHDLTVIHNEDHICFADGGKSMRNDEAGSSLHHLGECVLNPHFRSGIDRGGCFVENQHGGKCEHNARNAEKLFLTLGKTAVIADYSIIALWQTLDEAVRMGSFRSGNDLRFRGVRLTNRDIFFDGCRFDPCVLQYHTVRTAQAVSRDITNIRIIYENLAAIYVIEAHEQSDQSGFTATRRSNDGNTASVRNTYGEITNQGFVFGIGEGDITDINIALGIGKNLRILFIGCLGFFFNQFKKAFRASHCVLQFRNDTGYLIEGFCILVCIAEKYREATYRKRYGICDDGKRTHKTHACIYNAVYNTSGRVDKGREENCFKGAFFKLLVHTLKGFYGFRFVSVCEDNLFIADNLIDICRLFSANFGLCGEKIMCTARNEACHKEGKGRNQNNHERDLPVDNEHKSKRSDDGNESRKELREAHQKTVGELVGVRNDTADDIAMRVRIAVRNRELLQFTESGTSEIAYDTEGNLIIDNTLNPLDQRGKNRGDRYFDQDIHDDIHVNLARLNDMVNGFTYGNRNIECQKNCESGAKKGEEKSRVIRSHIRQNLSDSAFGYFIFFHAVAPSFSFGN